MKHYKKILVMKQFLRKTLSLHFDFLLSNLYVQNENSKVVIEVVYMRLEMRFTRNEISQRHENNFLGLHCFSLLVKWNKILS